MMLQYDRVGIAKVQPAPAADPVRPSSGPVPAVRSKAATGGDGNRLREQSDKRAGAYLRTLTIILRMAPSPTIGAWASSGSRIVNCPGRNV